MKKLTLIRTHWLAIVAALILGFLMIWPYVDLVVGLGDSFKGIIPPIADDELFYNARIKDILDGHLTLGNAYLFEHKSDLPQQFLGEFLLVQPLKLLGLGVVQGRMIYNFVLPLIAFLLTYSALYLINRSCLWSLVFTTFLFFGLCLDKFIRPVSPQLNFIFWLTQFTFLWLLIENVRSRKFLFFNIINLGLLFYIYPYYWTFYLIFLCILAGIYFARDRALSFSTLRIIGGGLILGSPYLYNVYLMSRLPEYEETLTRLGLIYTHFPSGIKISLGAAGLLFLFLLAWHRGLIKLDNKTLFFVSGIVAAIVATNQHIITGRNLEFSSHYRQLAVFFFIFSFAYMWKALWDKNLKHKKLASGIVLSVIVIFTVQGTYNYLEKYSDISRWDNQGYSSALDWLNKNTPKGSVVYANNDVSDRIAVYTSNNVFYARNANLFLMSDQEAMDRFILNNFFELFDKDFITRNVRAIYGVRHIDAYGHAVQGNKMRKLLGIEMAPETYLPQDAVEEVSTRARKLKNAGLGRELSVYRVDYVLWDKNTDPNWNFDSQYFSSRIFENKDFVIYSVDFTKNL